MPDARYRDKEWLEQQYSAEGFTLEGIAESCGKESDRPHVHHIKPIGDGGEAYGLGNLVTLCPACHGEEHGRPDDG